VVNLHNGRLPEYRGANVLQWAIINGEPATAATLHYVDEGIDTGPVIDAVEVAITEADTALTLRERLVITDIALLERWLPQLLGGPAAAVPQEAARARTWPRRRPQDGAIDWNQTDRQIRDLTRALVPPWPGAWYVDRDGTTTVVSQVLEPDDIKRLRQEQSCQPCQPDFDAIASAGAGNARRKGVVTSTEARVAGAKFRACSRRTDNRLWLFLESGMPGCCRRCVVRSRRSGIRRSGSAAASHGPSVNWFPGIWA